MAMEFLREEHESCLPSVLEFRTQIKPFEQYMFMPRILEMCLRLLGGSLKSTYPSNLYISLLVVASAGTEIIFSMFGFLQTELKTCLGIEKEAGKLLFIYWYLNTK